MLIMVDRGSCHFVLKAKHVQDFGGTLMVVRDNIKHTQIPTMADDGKGGDIKIPSFMIGFSDGLVLEEAM